MTAMFDPKKARAEGGKNDGLPPGEYLIAIKRFERKTSKAGKKYLHCLFHVIAGAAKKRTFFENLSLDMANAGAMTRLSLLAEQCGVEGAFDLDEDAEIQKHLVGRPFKARISRTQSGQYTNNGIERYLMGAAVTDRDRAAMEEWVTAQADEGEWSGRGDDAPPPDDDDFASNYSGGGAKDKDDIPF